MSIRNIVSVVFLAVLSAALCFAQESPEPSGYYIGAAGLRNHLGVEAGFAGGHSGANFSGTLRVLKIQDHDSPQAALRLGIGLSFKRGLLHGGYILARDPKFGAQIGLGLWGSLLVGSNLYLGTSFEALKSKSTTNRQAVFSSGYRF